MTDKDRLLIPVAPRQISTPQDWDVRYANEQTRVLGLYFSQMDNVNAALLGRQGGRFLSNPYGAFSNPTTQALAAANTPYVVNLATTDTSGGVSLANNKVYVDKAGVYCLHYGLQLENTNAHIAKATVWVRKNGVDVPNSGYVYDITSTHGSSNGYLVASANFFVTALAGDYMELVIAADTTGLNIEAYAASASPYARPSVPSAVVTFSFVSAVPR